ncbi:hypothetical protein H2199_002174 [Coniosporium tulheliwenetii]|uniref:Uncharacterized protein n=1 Tax=Coniosporium tulheliwenetii TaxID=3383036 RepID=A0ACC2ZI49_9PEZI|nr:hypothetical protein H2199_002174 [Cladosporium sp. JES 115]
MKSFLRTHKVEDRPASRGIEDLPNELLLDVQDHLIESGKDVREPSRTRDLWSLSLTSKRFHAIANPKLYRVYDHKGVNHLRRFLSTISTRPDLAAPVKEVRIANKYEFGREERLRRERNLSPATHAHSLQARGDSSSPDLVHVSPQTRQYLDQATQGLNHLVNPQSVWAPNGSLVRRARGGYEEAEFALLLSKLPNLAHLLLALPHDRQDFYAPTQIMKDPAKHANGGTFNRYPELASLHPRHVAQCFSDGEPSALSATWVAVIAKSQRDRMLCALWVGPLAFPHRGVQPPSS